MAALKHLRLIVITDPAALLSAVRGDLSGADVLPRQVLSRPPPQDSPEFELMLRHAVAYPALVPLDAGSVSLTVFVAGGATAGSDSAPEP